MCLSSLFFLFNLLCERKEKKLMCKDYSTAHENIMLGICN